MPTASPNTSKQTLAPQPQSPTDVKSVASKRPTTMALKLCRWKVAVSLSALSLVTLVVQNATLVLMTRHARASVKPGHGFHTSTLVLNQEILKTLVCLVALGIERRVQTPSEYVKVVYNVVWQPECAKIALPAALFTLQNFLIFVSLANLDAMTFQVLSQTKLLSAALFSVWLLDRRLTRWQWISLVVLTAGVFLAQYEAATAGKNKPVEPTPSSPGVADPGAQFVGAVSCIISGLSSSFAGVYFEKVVKTTPPSLAVRNIHLGVFGIPFALVSMLYLDVWHNTDPAGFHFFRGYDAFTWGLVAVHALGGLLVATVVKYADNILKGFATAVAIIVSGVFASIAWHYRPTLAYVAGCSLVIVSIVVYQWAEAPRGGSQHTSSSQGDSKGAGLPPPAMMMDQPQK